MAAAREQVVRGEARVVAMAVEVRVEEGMAEEMAVVRAAERVGVTVVDREVAMVEAARVEVGRVGAARAAAARAAAAREAEATEAATVGVGTVADSEVAVKEEAAMGARRMCASGCACAPP